MNKKKEFLDRVDFAIAKGKTALSKKEYSSGNDYIPAYYFTAFMSSGMSVLVAILDETHPYVAQFSEKACPSMFNISSVEAGISILENLKEEIENGWLTSLKQLITAEIFSNFLEMAEHLLENNYKDAAAVMIGSVLEEHLRQLCSTYDVEITVQKGADTIPLKADQLNADLKKQGVYTTLEQKNVTAWLDLRNKAAHGKYSQYTIEQVKVMYLGVLNFVSQFR